MRKGYGNRPAQARKAARKTYDRRSVTLGNSSLEAFRLKGFTARSDPNLVENEVLDVIEEALRLRPQSVALRVHLGELLLRAGRAEEALEQLRRTLGLAPTHLEALSLAALAARTAGNEPGALAYERLVRGLLPRACDDIRVASSNPTVAPLHFYGDLSLLFNGDISGPED